MDPLFCAVFGMNCVHLAQHAEIILSVWPAIGKVYARCHNRYVAEFLQNHANNYA